MQAQMLDEVQLPDGTKYRMTYSENSGICFTSGSLSGLDLRTGGRIEWRYGNYSFPQTSTPKLHRQNNLGVVERNLKNGTAQLSDPLCVVPATSAPGPTSRLRAPPTTISRSR